METGDEADLAEDIAQITGRSGGLSVKTATDPTVLSVVRILGKDKFHGNKLEQWRVEEKTELRYPRESEKKRDQAKKFLEN